MTATLVRPSAPAAAKISLSDFRKGSPKLPPRVAMHGRAGVGKTETAGNAPEPVFILSPGETGLHVLQDMGRLGSDIPNIEVADWATYMGAIEALRTEQHGRKTLVIDTINGVEKIANVHEANTSYGGDLSARGFGNYQAGYRSMVAGIWKQMLQALDRLRVERQMMVILLAHTMVGSHKNPSGDDYNRWIPAFDGKLAWDSLYGWADVVLMADFEIFTLRTNSNDKNSKAKATGGQRRFFHTQWNPAWDAKNRHNMPAELEMGASGAEAWANLAKAMQPSADAK